MEAETPWSYFITQEKDDTMATPDQPADNTRAKQRTQTLTQEYALVATELTNPHKLLNEYAGSILDEDTGELLEYRHLTKHPKYKETWSHSYGNEIRRLVQGMLGRVNSIDTIFFINKIDVPWEWHKDITYRCIMCDYRKGKAEPNRTRLMVGGDKINYPDDCGTPTADLLTIKLLLNSATSTPHVRFLIVDTKNF